MNLKDEILAGESHSLEFKLVPNEDRIKYLKTVVAFANGRGGRILFGDLTDPKSDVCKALASNYSIRRKPNLGTQPGVYYLI